MHKINHDLIISYNTARTTYYTKWVPTICTILILHLIISMFGNIIMLSLYTILFFTAIILMIREGKKINKFYKPHFDKENKR